MQFYLGIILAGLIMFIAFTILLKTIKQDKAAYFWVAFGCFLIIWSFLIPQLLKLAGVSW